MIQADSSVPMYQQLARLLRERIERGELRVGDRLPSEAQLGKNFGISRITIRQALAELERDGLVTRVSGKGTFVQQRVPRVERLTALTGFGENMAALGLKPGYRTLRAERERVSPEMADRLQTTTSSVFVVERVLLADGQPVGKHKSYLPLWIVDQAPPGAFTPETLSQGSMYRYIEQAGARLYRAVETVEPALADADEARDLAIEPSSLVLRVARTVYDPVARPIEHVLLTYNANLYTYRVVLYAPGKTGES